MLVTAIAFFALAAIIGMVLLSFVLRGKHTPKSLVITHGPIAIAGLVLLIIYCAKHYPQPIESLVLFIIAGSSGLILAARDLMGSTVPKWLGLTHGLVALGGFVFLLLFQFSK